MNSKPRLLRITTVPISLKLLLQGQPQFFKQKGFEVLTVSADGPEVVSLKEQGIAHQVVAMTRKITPLQDLISLMNLIRIIKTFCPDIVHTHTPKAGLLGMLVAWICKVPVRMHTVAGLPVMEASGLKRKLLLFTEKITYACATGVYPNSKGLEIFIRSNISTKTPIAIIGRGSTNGIDTGHFNRTISISDEATNIRNRFRISEHDLVFSFVGRIVRDKGISELISAFKKLQNKVKAVHPQWSPKLLLIGPFEQDLDPLHPDDYAFLHNHADVILAGFQNDVRQWIAASDIFVFPSYREGFPNVVMQACCLQVPCIVSDINGCNEIIKHEETGLIVPAKNSQALYDAMVKLAFDADIRKVFGLRSRQYVVENFDQQFVWREILKEYKGLMGMGSRQLGDRH